MDYSHSHFIQFCQQVEDLLPIEIRHSEWFVKGGAASIFTDKYLPFELDTDYIQTVAGEIEEEFNKQK